MIWKWSQLLQLLLVSLLLLHSTWAVFLLWGLYILKSYYYYYYYYYTIWISLVTGLSFLVLLLNLWWSPPLRLQASLPTVWQVFFLFWFTYTFYIFRKLLVTTPSTEKTKSYIDTLLSFEIFLIYRARFSNFVILSASILGFYGSRKILHLL